MMVKRCDRCDAEMTAKQLTSGWVTVTVYPHRVAAGVRSDMEHLDLCPECWAAIYKT